MSLLCGNKHWTGQEGHSGHLNLLSRPVPAIPNASQYSEQFCPRPTKHNTEQPVLSCPVLSHVRAKRTPIVNWPEYFNVYARLVWINCFGVPLRFWKEAFFLLRWVV